MKKREIATKMKREILAISLGNLAAVIGFIMMMYIGKHFFEFSNNYYFIMILISVVVIIIDNYFLMKKSFNDLYADVK